jgi:hypothetical protein
MKPFELSAYTLIRTLNLIGLLVVCSFALLQSAPPPSAFGVWDRADKFDPKEYPFLKGFSFDQKWADLEKQPGVFDWSGLDEIIKKLPPITKPEQASLPQSSPRAPRLEQRFSRVEFY